MRFISARPDSLGSCAGFSGCASTQAQPEDDLTCLGMDLDADADARLDVASAVLRGFPLGFLLGFLRGFLRERGVTETVRGDRWADGEGSGSTGTADGGLPSARPPAVRTGGSGEQRGGPYGLLRGDVGAACRGEVLEE